MLGLIRLPRIPLVWLVGALACLAGCGAPGGAPVREMALVNAGAYDVRTVFTEPAMNLVYDLRYGNFDLAADLRVLAVASDGYRLLSADGALVRFVPFRYGDELQEVDYAAYLSGGAAGPRFACNQGDATTLYGWDGQFVFGRNTGVWTFPFGADLDGDGDQEVVVPSKSRGVGAYATPSMKPLRHLTKRHCNNGAPLSRPDDRRQLVAMRTDNWFAPPDVLVTDGRGKVVSKWKPAFPFYEMSAVTDASGQNAGLLAFHDQTKGRNRFVLTDAAGKPSAAVAAPGSAWVALPHVWLTGNGADDKSMVVLASSTGAAHRFSVYVYAADGTLSYHYQGAGDAPSLLVLPPNEGGNTLPTFLVGGRGRVLRFSPSRATQTPRHG